MRKRDDRIDGGEPIRRRRGSKTGRPNPGQPRIVIPAQSGTSRRQLACGADNLGGGTKMTDNLGGCSRILGTLRLADGTGIVRMEDRLGSAIGDVWSALTEPLRLGRWYGVVEGDLRLGGEFHARLPDAGDRQCRVDACEPPQRLALTMRDPDPQPGQPDNTVIEVTLSADGDHTNLVVEERGIPLNLLAAYGVGVQLHVESLADHLAGRERDDTQARWDELLPAYRALAANVN